MFKNTNGVKFMMASEAQKEVNGPSITKLLEMVKKTHPAALSIVMAECMERITEEAGPEITLVLRNRWFVGPLGKMVMEKDEHEGKSYAQFNVGQPTLRGMPDAKTPKQEDSSGSGRSYGDKDPLGGCVDLGSAGSELDMSKLFNLAKKEVDKNG